MLSASHTNEMTSDLKQLREGCQAVMKELLEVKSRVSKLEDLVRVLTVQRSPLSDLPKMTQYLPVTTSDGQTLDLGVHKGMSLKSSKENRVPLSTTSSAATSSTKIETAPRNEAEIILQGSVGANHKRTRSAAVGHEALQTQTSIDKHKQDPNDQKPLPPVPAAQPFPGLAVNNKPIPLKKGPQMAFVTAAKENLQPLSTQPPTKQHAPSKSKKWKEPPLFEQTEVASHTSKPETLFSFHKSPTFGGPAQANTAPDLPKTANEVASVKSTSSPVVSSSVPLKENKPMPAPNTMLESAKPMPYTELVASAMQTAAKELGGGNDQLNSTKPKVASMPVAPISVAPMPVASMPTASMPSDTTAMRAPSMPPAQPQEIASSVASSARKEAVSTLQNSGRLATKRSGIKMVGLEREVMLKVPVTEGKASTSANVPATPGTQVIKSPTLPPTPSHSTSKVKQELVSPLTKNTMPQSSGMSKTPALARGNTNAFQTPSASYFTPPAPFTAPNTSPFSPSTGAWNIPPTPSSTANTTVFQPATGGWTVPRTTVPAIQASPPFMGGSTMNGWTMPRTAAPATQPSSPFMSASAPVFQPSSSTSTSTPTQTSSVVPASLKSKMTPDQLKLFTAQLNKV